MPEQYRVLAKQLVDHIEMTFRVDFTDKHLGDVATAEDRKVLSATLDKAGLLHAKTGLNVKLDWTSEAALEQKPNGRWILKEEVTAWLAENIKGKMSSEVDDKQDNFTLVFDDLNDATHFKLRWIG